jgi:hypothetical protein
MAYTIDAVYKTISQAEIKQLKKIKDEKANWHLD